MPHRIPGQFPAIQRPYLNVQINPDSTSSRRHVFGFEDSVCSVLTRINLFHRGNCCHCSQCPTPGGSSSPGRRTCLPFWSMCSRTPTGSVNGVKRATALNYVELGLVGGIHKCAQALRIGPTSWEKALEGASKDPYRTDSRQATFGGAAYSKQSSHDHCPGALCPCHGLTAGCSVAKIFGSLFVRLFALFACTEVLSFLKTF